MQSRHMSYALAALGLLILAWAWSEYRTVQQLRQSGIRVEARLDALLPVVGLRQNGYAMAYTFEHEGKKIEATDIRLSVPAGRLLETARKGRLNQPVEIVYLPDNPRITLPAIAVDGHDLLSVKLLIGLLLILAPLAERLLVPRLAT